MPIGSLLNAASSVAGAAAGAPMGPSHTDIAPNVMATLNAPFAVGRGARSASTPEGAGAGIGTGGVMIAVAVVIGALILARR